MSGKKDNSANSGFGLYASGKIVLGIVIAMGCLWIFSEIISFFTGTPEEKSSYKKVVEQYPYLQKADQYIEGLATHEAQVSSPDVLAAAEENIADRGYPASDMEGEAYSGHGETMAETQDVNEMPRHGSAYSDASANRTTYRSAAPVARESTHMAQPQVMTKKVIGVAFIDALIAPLEKELDKRFYGWRPNDIFSFWTDNVENYQLGVREVTRRSADILAERIARTGSNVSYNKYLNDAVNSLTVAPTSYWWPSAEGEYKRAMRNLRKYQEQLLSGEESFYTRPDNLIPLLIEFRTRLGDCDDKLVRKENDPDSQVSTFKADDRFYYAKGVASAILPLLEAIQQDYGVTLETRGGMETLHHAIESCKEASHLSPWFVMEGDYDGVLANHRANMATYISHARFYIGVLIKTLST